MEAGAPYEIRPTGPSDIRRIEGGIFNWGADFNYENNPYEMGLERLVDLEMEADFMGKDALRRIRQEGVGRRIVGVEIEGEKLDFNFTKWPVRADGADGDGGAELGRVTSALWSPRLERNIGYAWVPAGRSDVGTQLTVETESGTRAATVVPMPFVDPGKQIPKS